MNQTAKLLFWCKVWWRHQMETCSALLAICAGNSSITGKFPAQRPVTRSFDVFFELRLNERLSKQSWGWWVETQSCPSGRYCTGYPLKYVFHILGRYYAWVTEVKCKVWSHLIVSSSHIRQGLGNPSLTHKGLLSNMNELNHYISLSIIGRLVLMIYTMSDVLELDLN